jgi:hypothetical protein
LARARKTASFYLNASQTSGSQVRLSVRIGGVQCGSLLLKDRTSRHFRPLNAKRFGLLHDAPQPDVEWEHSSVRRFLEGAAHAISADTGHELARRESLIEAELLSQMKSRNSGDRADSLTLHRPVLYPLKGGLPFQFPLPIRARTRPELPEGTTAGHVDVLARKGRGGRCLRVFEVKRSGAPDVSHALDQAVTYCAALQYMLRRTPLGEAQEFHAAMGFGRTPARRPSIEAVAVVEDTPENRKGIERSALRLSAGSERPFKTFALFYKKDRASVIFGGILPAHLVTTLA